MSDITKCLNTQRKVRFKCYRYLAPVGCMQSYAVFCPAGGVCFDYWEIGKQ